MRRALGAILLVWTVCTSPTGLAPAPACAQDATFRHGDLTITDARMSATPASARRAGGYLTITNDGPRADRLMAAASAIAARTELHEMAMADGAMVMREHGGIDLPAGATVRLAPGGLHLMFEGLTLQVRDGDAVPVELTFARAGRVEVLLRAGTAGAYGQSDDKTDGASGHGGHDKMR